MKSDNLKLLLHQSTELHDLFRLRVNIEQKSVPQKFCAVANGFVKVLGDLIHHHESIKATRGHYCPLLKDFVQRRSSLAARWPLRRSIIPKEDLCMLKKRRGRGWDHLMEPVVAAELFGFRLLLAVCLCLNTHCHYTLASRNFSM